MNLAKRLQTVRGLEVESPGASTPGDPWAGPATNTPDYIADTPGSGGATEDSSQALSAVKERTSNALFDRMGSRISDTTLDEAELHRYVKEELRAVIDEDDIPLTSLERQRLVQEIADDVLGLGPLQRFLDDKDVTEIMVNGADKVYVEIAGKLHLTNVHFTSEEHLRRIIERIVSKVGRRIDESSPLVDARLSDGSRRQRDYSAARRQWIVAHHPQVWARASNGPESHPIGNNEPRDHGTSSRLRTGPAEHHRLWRHRNGKDNPAQCPFIVSALR